jgi:predicted nucleic acid-binding protein
MGFPIVERLLDSVILIDHLNGISKSTKYLSKLDPEKQAISVVTRAEILVGIIDDEVQLVIALLDQYKLLPIDKKTADLSAQLRKQYGWKLPDAFQAALCLQHDLKLVTRNTKDFNRKDHTFVEIPYKL